jgi:hypothetical protein
MSAAANEYRAKAFECLSLAECMPDPERRAEILRYARLWMQLTEPVGTSRSAYEVEHRAVYSFLRSTRVQQDGGA